MPWNSRPAHLVVALGLLVSAQPLAASQSASPPRKNPFSKLFAPDLKPQPREASKPTVVCGMTLIPIDPSIDPKIVVAPQQSDTRFTIRAVPPPVCR